MKFRYSPYELIPKSRQGVARPGPRIGCLLALETEFGIGYADLHPWEELGDEPLSRQLELLGKGQLTALTRNSVALAQRDAQARARRESLFQGLSIPPSHFLVTDPASIPRAYEQGFRLFKLKAAGVEDVLAFELPRDSRWRIDFNSRLVPAGIQDLLSQLDPARIDFIEDPYPWTPAGWEKLPVRFALDRGARPEDAPHWPEVLIIKPAYGEASELARLARKFVVTSYLDHPLGQAGAALFAAEAARDYPASLEPCGLLSHWAYERNEFSERIRTQGSRMLPPDGHGLGFDDLLAKQNWKAP